MVAINCPNLVWRQIGRYMSKVTLPEIVAALDDILENILHITEKTGRNTLPADFIECLPAGDYILLYRGISSFGEHSGYKARICDSESVFPFVLSHRSGHALIPVAYRRTHNSAEVPHDFKHGGFPSTDVAP